MLKTLAFLMVLSFAFPQALLRAQPDSVRAVARELLEARRNAGSDEEFSEWVRIQRNRVNHRVIRTMVLDAYDSADEHSAGTARLAADALGVDSTRAYVMKVIGTLYSDKGKYDSASFVYKQALELYRKMNNFLGLGWTWVGLGMIADNNYDIKEAEDSYTKALDCFKLCDTAIGLGGIVYQALGDIAYRTGRTKYAEEMYIHALLLKKMSGSISGQGTALQSLAEVYKFLGRMSEAEIALLSAWYLYKEAEDLDGQGNVLNGLGCLALVQCRDSIAKCYLQDAVMYHAMSGTIDNIGQDYLDLGRVAVKAGDLSDAGYDFDKSLSYFEKTRNPLGLGTAHMFSGELASKLGKSAEASWHYLIALPMLEKSGSISNQGLLLNRLGELASNQGKIAEAEIYFRKALQCFERAQNILETANAYENLGTLALKTNRMTEARCNLQKALPLYEKVGDPIGLGNVYNNLGHLSINSGNMLEAKEWFHRGLTLFQGANDPLGCGNVYRILAAINWEEGRTIEAETLYRDAARSFEKANVVESLGQIYYLLGTLAFFEKRNDSAMYYLDKSMPLLEQSGNPETMAFLCSRMADLAKEQGKDEEAIEYCRRAVFLIETLISGNSSSEQKMGLVEKTVNIFEKYTQILSGAGSVSESFHAAEQTKARGFLDRLAERGFDSEDSKSIYSRNLVSELASRRAWLEYRLGTIKQLQATDSLQQELQTIVFRLDSLLYEIRSRNPRYASVSYPQPIAAMEFQKTTLRQGEVLIEFLVSDTMTLAFVLHPESLKSVAIPISRDVLTGTVHAFRGENTASSAQDIASSEPSKLYKMVVEPIEKELRAGDKLIIVPDGVLALLPFEGLSIGTDSATGKQRYLIEKYQISYSQSATVLAELRKEKPMDKENSLLAFGDPVYDFESYERKQPERGDPLNPCIRGENEQKDEADTIPADIAADELTAKAIQDSLATLAERRDFERSGGTLCRLPFSGEEVSTIAGLFPRQDVRLHLRADATEDRVKESGLEKYKYVLFSCHGLSGKSFNGLALSQNIPGAKENGYLLWQEAMNCSFDADMIVLSACETGTGKLQPGEGIMGLTRAMLYAGSRSVVASLWSVNDPATKELMVGFFTKLVKEGKDKATALREAKLDMMRGGKYAHPYYWAPFVMYGE
jgi:CHAT domain-containing protein/tetratricopeptide (TPR) repeat protein